MRNKSMLAVIATAAISSSAALASVVQIQANPGAPWQRGTTQGGGFRATSISGFNGLMGGRGGTATSFITFCLERDEFLAGNNVQYDTVISDSADEGGIGGPSPDPISSTTAALYREFRRGGTYGGLAPAGLNAASWSTALTDALQIAIWFEEEELTAGNAMWTGNQLAQDLHAWAEGYVLANNLGQYDIGNVRVLRLYNADGSNAQDVLTIIPLPSAAGLACLGLIAVGGRRRRVL